MRRASGTHQGHQTRVTVLPPLRWRRAFSPIPRKLQLALATVRTHASATGQPTFTGAARADVDNLLFDKILIANRGEIACRIIKTARSLGIGTVAVYSDADAGAMHTQLADEAIHIGGSAATDSYLVTERILDAARATGAEAIHPG